MFPRPHLRRFSRWLHVTIFAGCGHGVPLIAAPSPPAAPVHIVLVGDSTVTDNAGWGLGFRQFLADGVKLSNTARGGRSSMSFIQEGSWEKALALKGDYYLVQFGHNDEPGKPGRSTTEEEYRRYMERYVDEARAAGARPVLVTSLVRRQFAKDDPHKITSSLQNRAGIVRAIAREKRVPLVELHDRSKELCEKLGRDGCLVFSPPKENGQFDGTHLNGEGYVMFGRLVAEELRRAVPALAPLIREEARDPHPVAATLPLVFAGEAPSFRNPDLPIEQRVNDLISRLTIEEKISQTLMSSAAIPRLGIPKYDWWNEALHGVARNGVATVFPQAIGLAATWNPALHERIAGAIATEARAKNNEALAASGGDLGRYQGLTIWSPNINIFRDPRWGRGQETYGEDPFLTSCLGVAFVRGLQGDDPRYLKTVATVKHFAVHSGPEPARHRFDAVVGARDLWETYLPAFEAGVREGGAASVMSAYNAVNGVPAAANVELLQKILRGRWGFSGAVVGDVDNVADMWRPKAHGFSKDAAEASAAAIKAGNDLCGGKTYEALPEALKRGLLTEADIDAALRHLFILRFRLGQFDPADRVPWRAIPPSANNSPENDQLALDAARQSLVLLKNDGTLPFDVATLKTVAILGPTGNAESALLGNYAGTPSRKTTLTASLRARLEARGVKVLVEPGVPLVKGFRVSGAPFPKDVLFTDATRSVGGLRGEVFAHETQDSKKPLVDGRPASARTDAQVDLQWDETQPIEGVPIANAGLRWTGVLVPHVSGEHLLGIVAEGAARLYLDNKLVIDSWRREPERPLSTTVPLEAGRTYAVRLEYVQLTRKGRIQFGWIAPGQDDSFAKAMAAARAADHIVLTLGITPDLEGESMSVTAEGFNGGDRLTLDLPATQRELLARVAELKKPTVVVLTTGAAINFDDSQANAVLLAWYYGQRGADAVADALLGETNPAGRLPITFYRNTDELPAFDDYAMTNRTYRYYIGKPLYAFGHGLSYTRFDYEKIALSPAIAPPGSSVQVSVTVTNTGARDGDEVVQVYATAENPPVPMPRRQLVAFERVPLRSGETKTLAFSIPVERLRRWDEAAGRYVVDPGVWRLDAGPASDHLPLSAKFRISAK